VLDPFLGLALGEQAQKRLALEVEQVLFRHHRRMRELSACHHRGQLSPDQPVVVADAAGLPCEVNAQLQRGRHGLPANGNRRAGSPLVSLQA
jgi:hypothetical protein